jgi:hypothetical protein
MNISELDDALSAALNSLAAAQAVLRKSLPGHSIDVLRKIDEPRASARPLTLADYDAALADLEDLAQRVAKLGAEMDMDARHAPRKTMRYEETHS